MDGQPILLVQTSQKEVTIEMGEEFNLRVSEPALENKPPTTTTVKTVKTSKKKPQEKTTINRNTWKQQAKESWKGTLGNYMEKYEKLANSHTITAIAIEKQNEDELVLALNQAEDMFKVKVTAGETDIYNIKMLIRN